jgi:hypothetical protein
LLPFGPEPSVFYVAVAVVLYGCETLREESRLRVFENRMQRRTFGTKRDNRRMEKKLHNEELHDLYSSPSVITIMKSRRMRWAKHVARMKEKRNSYMLLVGTPEGRKEATRKIMT